MVKNIIITASVFAAVAVLLGALGTHALEGLITTDKLISFETGIRYQFYHAIALLAITGLQYNFKSKFYNYSALFFIIGIILFSGSIYLLSLREIINSPQLIILGPVTPLGGISFIIGWLLLIKAGSDTKKTLSNNL